MLVKDLIGAELDFYVGKAIGLNPSICSQGCVLPYVRGSERPVSGIQVIKLDQSTMRKIGWHFDPSDSWSIAGPLIHEYGLSILQITDELWESEYSYTTDDATVDFKAIYGETPLIAAMRALVASVFGDEVESIKED